MKPLKERLAKTKVRRQQVLDKFGFVPSSILQVNRGKLSRSLFSFQKEDPRCTSYGSDKARAKHEELRQAGYEGWKSNPSRGGCGRSRAGLSIMPAELVDFFIKFYAGPGQMYLDPFMGHGIRLQVAALRGMHYTGYDTSAEFYAYIQYILSRIDPHELNLLAYHEDARDMSRVSDNSADFCFTSPPYWNIEDYGDDPRDLANSTTSYNEFVEQMGAVFAQLFAKIKPGGWCIFNVNDFVMDAALIPYHCDIMRVAMAKGFVPKAVWILTGSLCSFMKVFSVKATLDGRCARCHEYALVWQKP